MYQRRKIGKGKLEKYLKYLKSTDIVIRQVNGLDVVCIVDEVN